MLVCTCTSSRLIPSLATYLCGQLGMHQVYAAYDLIAACAGMPYGVAEAARLLQEVERPVLVVCVEKFSDKIGNVRTSRMIFGDGAAAMVVGPAPDGQTLRHRLPEDLRQRPGQRGELDPLAQPGVRQQHHGLRPPGEGAGRPLPRADDRRDRGAAAPGRGGRLPARQHRPDRAAPGEQDDGDPAGRTGRAERRPALLQHREGRATRRPRASRWPSTTPCATA